MTNEEIRELIQLVTDTGVAELEVQRGEDRVRIRRAVNHTGDHPPQPFRRSYPTKSPVIAAKRASRSRCSSAIANETIVKSPIVGTFYEAPTPGDPPFVRIGEHVEPGKVLCIIESMKLMNEIEAEIAGIVESKLVQNGQPVEYGEALFGIRPAYVQKNPDRQPRRNRRARHLRLQGSGHPHRCGLLRSRPPQPARPLRRPGHLHRPRQKRAQLPRHSFHHQRRRNHQCRRHPSRLRFLERECRLRRSLRVSGIKFIGPTPEVIAPWGSRNTPAPSCRNTACPSCPARTGS